MKASKPTKMYKLEYTTRTKLIEVPMSNKPLPIILWKRKQLLNAGTHRSGELKYKPMD